MTCRRAAEIDLADALYGAPSDEQTAFREHYPRCPQCSAEVATWTSLHELLTASDESHPPAKKLLWMVDRPQSLSEGERIAIEQHVADCRSCRDEMTTLRGLDLHALTRPLAGIAAANVSIPLRPEAAAGWRAWLGPRLAFAVVAVALVPLIVSRVGVPPSVQESAPPVQEPAGDGMVGATRGTETLREAPAPPALAKPAAPARNATEPRSSVHERAKAAPAPQPSQAAGSAQGAGRQERLATAPLADAGGGERRRLDRAPTDVPPTARGAAPAERAIHLDATTVTRFTADGDAPVTLAMPTHAPAARGTAADVRIVDAARRRELRERATVGSDGLSTTVPGSWLAAGSYQVEVRLSGVLAVYRLAVER